MHDRRAGGADGLLACPFLALAGDREMRIDVPDRRHRCYAEPEPAPRAIAHQQEYCLTPSFAACPTFQDWAKREAARVITAGEGATAPDRAPDAPPDAPARTVHGDEPVVWRADDARDRGTAPDPTLWGDGRAWSAPPPWVGAGSEDGATRAGEPGQGTPRAVADRSADDVPVTGAAAEPRTLPPAVPATVIRRAPASTDDDMPSFLARRAPVGTDRERVPGARAADRLGAGDERERTRGAGADRAAPSRPGPDLRPDGTPRPGRTRGEDGSDGRAAPGTESHLWSRVPGGRAPGIGGGRLGGPDWERPLRRESYPSLHMPAGLPHLPRLWLGVVALVISALVLFLAPTLLPGFFGAQPAATPAATPSPVPSVSIAPTPPPAPTPVVYTVVQGDTLSGIAARYGLTIAELLKANPQIRNENKLAIGDHVTIPVKVVSPVGAGTSTAPTGTAAP